MKKRTILRLLIFLLGFVTLTMLIPLILAAAYGEKEMFRAFGIPLGAALILSLLSLLLTRKQRAGFTAVDGLLLVFLAWVLTGLLGGAPYYLSGHIPRFADAVFESVSGFTTTGLSVIADVEALPRSLLLWRGMTHWFGGMGIVLLTVALLPLLGAGGPELNSSPFFNAESPGPEKDKITPKISETAKILWFLYTGLTLLLVLLLMLGGMDWLDAVIHSFSTMATGGFSSRNGSIADYRSPWIEWVCTIFMFLAGFNFSLLCQLLRGKYRNLLRNSEARAYWGIILVSIGIITASTLQNHSLGSTLRYASFQTASILSTTGFAAADHTLWPPLAQGVLFFLMFVGGCSGSTAGGFKVIRHVVLFKQMKNEIKRLLYPRGVFSIRLHKKAGRKDAVYGVVGFASLYLILLFAASLLVSFSGLDLFSSMNVALITLGNIGLGLGKTGPGFVFSGFPAYINWGLSFIMIAGRLELWAALVFFSRHYWRR
jgi:trk system potassium uptake protein TrkH